jgi:hypothetical protein
MASTSTKGRSMSLRRYLPAKFCRKSPDRPGTSLCLGLACWRCFGTPPVAPCPRCHHLGRPILLRLTPLLPFRPEQGFRRLPLSNGVAKIFGLMQNQVLQFSQKCIRENQRCDKGFTTSLSKLGDPPVPTCLRKYKLLEDDFQSPQKLRTADLGPVTKVPDLDHSPVQVFPSKLRHLEALARANVASMSYLDWGVSTLFRLARELVDKVSTLPGDFSMSG